MDAGILDKRVTIDQRTTVQDSSGDPVVTWEPIAEVWAKISPMTGREGDVGLGLMAEFDTRIRMRYSPVTAALTAVHRIRYAPALGGERIYNVVYVADVETQHSEVRIDAKSGLNDG